MLPDETLLRMTCREGVSSAVILRDGESAHSSHTTGGTTGQVLRNNKEVLLTIMEVFIHDPLYMWALTTAGASKRQADDADDAGLGLGGGDGVRLSNLLSHSRCSRVQRSTVALSQCGLAQLRQTLLLRCISSPPPSISATTSRRLRLYCIQHPLFLRVCRTVALVSERLNCGVEDANGRCACLCACRTRRRRVGRGRRRRRRGWARRRATWAVAATRTLSAC